MKGVTKRTPFFMFDSNSFMQKISVTFVFAPVNHVIYIRCAVMNRGINKQTFVRVKNHSSLIF